ncbi:MAG: hypothetical protein WBC73_06280, partial [Phormidesmis sp.]
MTKILIEAEQMVLDGYRVETNGDVDASGGQLIKLSGSTGTASLDFSVEQAGTYDLTAWYYDESDGNSPVTVEVGSKSESWTFDEDTDSGRASKGNRRSRVIKGVELAAGLNRLKVTGNVESGENSRFDSFKLVPSSESNPPSDPNPPAEPGTNGPVLPADGELLIEAEQMQLNGYIVEAKDGVNASGGKLIKLAKGVASGTATIDFTVSETNSYDVVVSYYDENDGKSEVTVQVGDRTERLTFGENTDKGSASAGNRRTWVIKGVELEAGSNRLQATGELQAGELSRFDSFKLVPSSESNPPSNPNPTSGEAADYSNAGNGVILNLQEGVALSAKFGALDEPQLMPLGDSITAGQHRFGAVPGGYRIQFWERAVADGLSIDFVGNSNNKSGGLGDGDHAGQPGRSIGGTTSWVRDSLSSYSPDAI